MHTEPPHYSKQGLSELGLLRREANRLWLRRPPERLKELKPPGTVLAGPGPAGCWRRASPGRTRDPLDYDQLLTAEWLEHGQHAAHACRHRIGAQWSPVVSELHLTRPAQSGEERTLKRFQP